MVPVRSFRAAERETSRREVAYFAGQVAIEAVGVEGEGDDAVFVGGDAVPFADGGIGEPVVVVVPVVAVGGVVEGCESDAVGTGRGGEGHCYDDGSADDGDGDGYDDAKAGTGRGG